MSRTIRRNMLAIATILLWSTAFPTTRGIAGQLAASELAFARCLIAAICLLIMWLFQKERKLPAIKDVVFFALAGFTGFSGYLLAFNIGLRSITAAEASVIVALTPIGVAVISHFALGEKLKTLGWVSTFGAFAGVAILMLWGNGLHVQPGMLWILLAALQFTSYMLLNRLLTSKGYSSLDIVTWSMVIAALTLIWALPSTVHTLPELSIGVLIAIIYLGVLPSGVSYVLWSAALALANKSSEVTNYMFVTPLLATIEGIIFLSEAPTPGTYIGGGLIIVMLVLFNISKDK